MRAARLRPADHERKPLILNVLVQLFQVERILVDVECAEDALLIVADRDNAQTLLAFEMLCVKFHRHRSLQRDRFACDLFLSAGQVVIYFILSVDTV